MFKRVLSLILTVAMLMTLLPAAMAEPAETTDPAPVTDPTDPPADPTDPPADPTDPPADPTDPPADPTDPPTDPTDAPADPTTAPVDPVYGYVPYAAPVTMYVYTENGGSLNVRSEPRVKSGNVIGSLKYGATVTVLGYASSDPSWLAIPYSKGTVGVGFVMAKFLVSEKPKPREKSQRELNLEELYRQERSYKVLSYRIDVETRYLSGTIYLREGPGVAARSIGVLPYGQRLQAVGETNSWWHVIEPISGVTGFVYKNHTTTIGVVIPEEPKAAAKAEPAELVVNDQFAIRCQWPEGYSLQVVNNQDSKLAASVLSEDAKMPLLYVTVTPSEAFPEAANLNSVDDAGRQAIEDAFLAVSPVNISYRETKAGDTILLARSAGEGTDFLDALLIHQGYEIEFVLTPSQEAGTTALLEQQVGMCIDALMTLTFAAPAQATEEAAATPGPRVVRQRIVVGN